MIIFDDIAIISGIVIFLIVTVIVMYKIFNKRTEEKENERRMQEAQDK